MEFIRQGESNMKKIKFILAVIMMVGLVGTAWAHPILNTDEYFADGVTLYGTYTNSGDFLFIEEGNTNPVGDVQTKLRTISGYESIVLTESESLFMTGIASNSGTWAVVSPIGGVIDFYAVKAGNYYALYVVSPADSTGSWSTYDIWSEGLINDWKGAGGNGGLGISHLVGYNPSAVPEPTTILLLGLGLMGLAGLRRKIQK